MADGVQDMTLPVTASRSRRKKHGLLSGGSGHILATVLANFGELPSPFLLPSQVRVPLIRAAVEAARAPEASNAVAVPPASIPKALRPGIVAQRRPEIAAAVGVPPPVIIKRNCVSNPAWPGSWSRRSSWSRASSGAAISRWVARR